MYSKSVQNINNLSDQILKVLHKVCGKDKLVLHEPQFCGNEWIYTKDCLDSNFVSTVGSYVDRFEEELKSYTGAKHVIAMINGTSALHMALLLIGIKPGDEILLPSLTFVATANAVNYCGAIPHFIDSNEDTLGIDSSALSSWLNQIAEIRGNKCFNKQTGRPIHALIPMHTFGHPCDLDNLKKIAHDYKLIMVEDAAESIGSWYKGCHTGTIGQIGILSFNGNKTITTGGGGAILTNDDKLAKRAKHLSTTAKKPHRWIYEHDEIGFNYRLPNINAALGCAQLEQLPDFLTSKRRLFTRYAEAFDSLKQVRLISEPAGSKSNYWLQTIVLDESVANQQNAVLKITNDYNIMTRPVWTLLHKLKPYHNFPKAPLPIAESLERRIINIPSSVGLA